MKEQLTEEMIEAGAKLTAKLEEMGLPIAAAMWLFMPEINEWRLLFASTEVPQAGPLSVYRKIREAREALGGEVAAAPSEMIKVLDANQELIQQFRTALSTGAGIARIRFTRNVINGRFIEDALIYRIT